MPRNVGNPTRRFPSPLRYPGGKGKIANYMKLLVVDNHLVGCDYVELYAGGAAVALSLLYEDFVSTIHINDLDRAVAAFWCSALEETDALCRLISDTHVTIEEWERQRLVQRDPTASRLELGFSTFFLNRTNRSGILEGGVIGGRDQTGPFKLDARYNKDTLIQRLEKLGRFRDRIKFTQLDSAEYLRTQVAELKPSTLLYLDPPYYVQGSNLYPNSYDHQDHEALAELIQATRLPWVVSYDHTPEIVAMYVGCGRVTYGLSYSAADRYKGGEVMFFSKGLRSIANVDPPKVRFVDVDDYNKTPRSSSVS